MYICIFKMIDFASGPTANTNVNQPGLRGARPFYKLRYSLTDHYKDFNRRCNDTRSLFTK